MAEGHCIDAALVRSLFHYNKETGEFTNRKTGRRAGSLFPTGYIKIRVNRVWKRAHRLAWLYVYGDCLPEQVDHINGNRSDNRIANLRASDPFLNQQNRTSCERGNRTGLLGVRPLKSGRFAARIRARNTAHELGVFDTAQEAHQAYLEAKAALHPHAWLSITHKLRTSAESSYDGRPIRQESAGFADLDPRSGSFILTRCLS